jgi:hypothetical protein
MAGCYQEPEFPVVPEIDFESVFFKQGDTGFDTLIVRVRFQDGDGDLGLGGEEGDPPYHPFDTQPKPNGDPCLFSDRFDTINCPGLPLEYDCLSYEPPPFRFGQDLINDTVYREINENYNNFIIDLMTKKNGQFEVYDFREKCQPPLSGRFPRLRDDFNTEGPLEGVIEYKAPSSAYLALFRNDTLKLRIRIKDRALHDSNVEESCEFTLNDLLELGECLKNS